MERLFYDRRSGTRLEKIKGPMIVKSWWTLWIFSTILSQSSYRVEMRANTAGELTLAAAITIFTSLIDIAVAIMAIQVVKKLTDQQEEKYQSLAVQQVPIAETTANNEPSFTFKQPEKNKPSSDFLWD
ncbi:MAG: DUF4328 domain-containing protein [Thermoactinomyces sp.]